MADETHEQMNLETLRQHVSLAQRYMSYVADAYARKDFTDMKHHAHSLEHHAECIRSVLGRLGK